MSSLEPLLNLIALLTVLSIAAERASNFLKLGHPALRNDTGTEKGEKEREHRITLRSLLVGVALAILVKANLFEIFMSIDSPWDTLGWFQAAESQWVPAAATASIGTAAYALVGCAITGMALGFGSKFWHEILDGVLELRGITKALRKKYTP
jgi:hypothetical protein